MAPMTEEIDRMLTDGEAAPLLGVMRNTMAKWRATGNPDAPSFIRIGRNVRYKLSTLRAWIANREELSCSTKKVD